MANYRSSQHVLFHPGQGKIRVHQLLVVDSEELGFNVPLKVAMDC